ncbi:MAG: hypothetical protein GWP05_07635 [Anaerolineaceae bacterium]|nr:hypothetical protein [Anaerolineaceae bacterium]
MDSDDRGSRGSLQESLSELAANIDGLIQTATWQLTLAQEMKSQLVALGWSEEAYKATQKTSSKKGSRRRKR